MKILTNVTSKLRSAARPNNLIFHKGWHKSFLLSSLSRKETDHMTTGLFDFLNSTSGKARVDGTESQETGFDETSHDLSYRKFLARTSTLHQREGRASAPIIM